MASAAAMCPEGQPGEEPVVPGDEFGEYTWRSGTDVLGEPTDVEVRPGRKLCVARRPPASPEMPTVLFVHGSAASMTQFLPLAAALAGKRGYGVVAYDWLGCGRSDKPQDWDAYSGDELFEDLAAIWARYCAEEGPGRTYVVGHSFGTHLALRLALQLQRAGTSCAGLALISGVLNFPAGGHPIFRLPLFALEWLQPTLTRSFLSMAFTEGCDAELLASEGAKCDANPMHMCKAYYRQMSGSAPAGLGELAAPVLVLRGDRDGCVSKEGAEMLAAALPGAAGLVAVPSASHNFMLEQPWRAAQLVVGFVECKGRQ